MNEETAVSRIRACHCQCNLAAKLMDQPLKEVAQRFYNKPTRRLLAAVKSEVESTRDMLACDCQCNQTARVLGLPMDVTLDVFKDGPTKRLLAIAERVDTLLDGAEDEGEEFDPVAYITEAAKNRGWGIYGEEEEKPEGVLLEEGIFPVDIRTIEDPLTFKRVSILLDLHEQDLVKVLSDLVTGVESWRTLLDKELAEEVAEELRT